MADVLIPTLIITLLIVLNGIFVAAEFAIVGVSRAEVEQAQRSGSRAARRVKAILDDPRKQDRFIATAQLGITLASLGLGMYGEHILAAWLAGLLEGWGVGRWIAAHTLATVLSITFLTYFHIVIGEMVPKAFALQFAGRTSFLIAPMIAAFQIAAYPLVIALNGIGNGLLRAAGIDRSQGGSEQFRTPEELAYIVRESQAGGLLRDESANVVGELLALDDRSADEVMVPRVHVTGIPVGASDDEIIAIFADEPHARFPVYRETIDEIIGVLHLRDLLDHHVRGETLSSAPLRQVGFLPQSASVDDILAAMRATRSQMVVVMDEHGGTAGIVTLEDLFEEVIGEYTDDGTEVPELYRDGEGRVHAQGTARVEEVADALGVVLEFEEADTVSGLVLALLKRPPVAGDRVVWEEASFEVLTVHGHGVETCLVTRVPAADSVYRG